MHERQAIREAIVAALTATPTTTVAGARVFKRRVAPVPTEQLPAINVYVDNEVIDTSEAERRSPPVLTRPAIIAVEAWVSVPPDQNVDDALDAIALQIETAMDVDLNLDNTAFYSSLQSTTFGVSPTGDRPMGVIHLEYEVIYKTDLRVAAPVDLFNTADVKTSIGGTQAAADQAHDTITGINPPPP